MPASGARGRCAMHLSDARAIPPLQKSKNIRAALCIRQSDIAVCILKPCRTTVGSARRRWWGIPISAAGESIPVASHPSEDIMQPHHELEGPQRSEFPHRFITCLFHLMMKCTLRSKCNRSSPRLLRPQHRDLHPTAWIQSLTKRCPPLQQG